MTHFRPLTMLEIPDSIHFKFSHIKCDGFDKSWPLSAMLCRTSLRNPLRLIDFARIVPRFETKTNLFTDSHPLVSFSIYRFAQYLDCAQFKYFPRVPVQTSVINILTTFHVVSSINWIFFLINKKNFFILISLVYVKLLYGEIYAMLYKLFVNLFNLGILM